ncbi:hypothetical protein M3182_24715 [Mesobacillus maritimus]|uniref:hypothetical protein n=1 Tax=Mesobacillus maritimus TaxID=1643336 RepID=UPI00203D2C71|nr:hypothetical protein [Mesobacillus maritimus]MCM3588830.1 hypothetical protein [Mesobacillus maritimus]MCM3670712.1 hypothetical protein [Mesobacillus maritimus]
MIHNVSRRLFWMLVGSTVVATFIGIALYKAGLISYHEKNASEKDANQKKKRIRIGKVRLS